MSRCWILAHVGAPGSTRTEKISVGRRDIVPSFPVSLGLEDELVKKGSTTNVPAKPSTLIWLISSLITQLRTGKIGLAHCLHAISNTNFQRCFCKKDF